MPYYAAVNTVNITDLVGQLMIDAPHPITEIALLRTAIEYCSKTRCWANTQTMSVASGNANVTLVPFDDANISDIINIYYTDSSGVVYPDPINKIQADYLNNEYSNKVVSGYYRSEPNTIVLAPIPIEDIVLSVDLVLIPLRTALTLPEFLYNEHWDAIEAGAKYRLCGQLNRPWGDPNTASWCKAQFEALMGTGNALFGKDGTRKPLRSGVQF